MLLQACATQGCFMTGRHQGWAQRLPPHPPRSTLPRGPSTSTSTSFAGNGSCVVRTQRQWRCGSPDKGHVSITSTPLPLGSQDMKQVKQTETLPHLRIHPEPGHVALKVTKVPVGPVGVAVIRHLHSRQTQHTNRLSTTCVTAAAADWPLLNVLPRSMQQGFLIPMPPGTSGMPLRQ